MRFIVICLLVIVGSTASVSAKPGCQKSQRLCRYEHGAYIKHFDRKELEVIDSRILIHRKTKKVYVLADIVAPSSSAPQCAEEKLYGQRAKQHLAKLLTLDTRHNALTIEVIADIKNTNASHVRIRNRFGTLGGQMIMDDYAIRKTDSMNYAETRRKNWCG